MSTVCRGFNAVLAEGSAPLSAEDLKSRPCLRIDGALTIAEAACWHARLAAQLTGEDAVLLDLSDTTAVDATGLQLLCAVRRGALAAGKPFGLTGAPALFFAACHAAGIAPAELGVFENQ